jgi:hypothetical protein
MAKNWLKANWSKNKILVKKLEKYLVANIWIQEFGAFLRSSRNKRFFPRVRKES